MDIGEGATNDVHPLVALLVEELQWMRERFAELPDSPGHETMRKLLEDLEGDAGTLGAMLQAQPVDAKRLERLVHLMALRVDATRKALERGDDRLYFLLLAGGGVILRWSAAINQSLSGVESSATRCD